MIRTHNKVNGVNWAHIKSRIIWGKLIIINYIGHIKFNAAIKQRNKVSKVLANDIDVVVLLLHHHWQISRMTVHEF